MPKGFTDKQKEIVRAKLLEKGRDCLATYGIKKTNVEDLTQAAGISKGAFYLFFNSKEELFFEILEQYEAEIRGQVLALARGPKKSPQAKIKATLKAAFAFWETSAIRRNLKREDYQALLRKLPEEQVTRHLRQDEAFVADLLEKWQRAGIKLRHNSKTISGLMKALFFVSLHKDDFGPEAYPETMDLLMDWVAEYLVQE